MSSTIKANSVLSKLLASNGFLIATLGAESRRRFMHTVSQWEVGWSEQSVLTALLDLSGSSPITQKQVADFVNVDPRNLVSVIDSLQKRNLAERTPHPDDRRSYHLRLTEAGASLAHKLRAESIKLEDDMFGSLSGDERATLNQLLVKLYKSTEEQS